MLKLLKQLISNNCFACLNCGNQSCDRNSVALRWIEANEKMRGREIRSTWTLAYKTIQVNALGSCQVWDTLLCDTQHMHLQFHEIQFTKSYNRLGAAVSRISLYPLHWLTPSMDHSVKPTVLLTLAVELWRRLQSNTRNETNFISSTAAHKRVECHLCRLITVIIQNSKTYSTYNYETC